MPPRNRLPADAERLETGTQGHKHAGVVADYDVRGAPVGDGLAADLHHAGEVLAIETAGAHNRPTIPVEQEDAVKPMPLELDQIPDIDEPDLVGRRSLPGTFVGVRWAFLRP